MHVEEKLKYIEKQLQVISARLPQDFANGYACEVTEELDLYELWRALWSGKWLILVVTLSFAIASVLYVFSLPNVYRSEALLAPAEESSQGGIVGLSGSLGGIASLAGVDIGGGISDKTTITLAVLKSRDFIFKFIDEHDLLVPLMAVESWDIKNNELVIDGDVYDIVKDRWVRDSVFPRAPQPTLLEAYEKFTKIMNIYKDEKTGLVHLSVEYYSPILAKEWVDKLVLDINEEMRRRDVSEATKSIVYLKDQLGRTSLADLRTVFYELIEEQTKTVMFAEIRDEYVFKTIDKAVVPERKAKPQRALICILFVFLGAAIAVVVLIVRWLMSSQR